MWYNEVQQISTNCNEVQMKEKLLRSSVIHADETVVQVLREPNKKAQTDSRMWVYCAGKYKEHSNILFEYSPMDHVNRSSAKWRGPMG